MVTRHRVTCAHPDCADRGRARVWRENCAECAEETADRHRRRTGHPVEVAITDDDMPMWELRRMARLLPARGWW